MMLRRSHYVAVATVAVITVALLCLPFGFTRTARLALTSLFIPLFGLSATARDLTAEAAHRIQPRSTLLERLRRLEQENQQLRLEQLQASEARRENAELRQALGWQRQAHWRARLAQVVGRDPANWWRTIHIDLGSRDGIRTNLPVLTVDGLVGRVAEVGWNRSLVALVGDPNCRVSATILDTRDHGIVGPGTSGSDAQIAHLTFLPNNDQIRPGQWVLTSGLGLFPAGIPIGKVLDTRKVGYGMYTEARVKLAARLGGLREVWVVWP
jgi:rod shape-determining protein MreC